MSRERAPEAESTTEPRAGASRHLGRTAAWLAKQVEVGLGEVDLSMSQYRVLCLLDAGPSVASALADRLAVRRPSVTAIMEGLVNRGLVTRKPVEDDRRCVSHTLTDQGYRLLAEADGAVEARLGALAGKLGDGGAGDELLGGLGLWHQAMERHLSTRHPSPA